ncbi:MAG: peptide chain release factor 1 [Deltaproteobacteria bacterium]|nr:MAG: peptide chain release factor 1 [Deltaproteobacteria bacterium]
MNFEERIARLLEFKGNRYPIASLYLKLGPAERENFKYKIILKNLIKEKRERLDEMGFSDEALKSVESDLKRITDYIDSPDNITGCRGVAIFSSTGEGIWEVFKLPLVYRNRLVIDYTPLVRQLVTVKDEFGDIAVVVVDRKKARLFRIGLNGAEEVLDYFYPEATRSTKFQAQEGKFRQRVSPVGGGGEVPHGYGEYGFHRMIENEMHQHFKYVSEKLFDYYKENRFDWLIIGGPEQAVSDFSHHLHTYLRDRILGTVAVDNITMVRPDEVFEKGLDLLEAKERRDEKRIIEEFEQKLASGLAVNGLESTLKALAMGQIRILMVVEGFTHSGFKCPESGILVLEENENLCPEGKKPLPVVDVVDDLIEEALGQGAEVEVVMDEEAKKKIQGVGAILRFKV